MSVLRRVCSLLAILALLLGSSLHATEAAELLEASGGLGHCAASCVQGAGAADPEAAAEASICPQATCTAIPAVLPRAETAFAVTIAAFAPPAADGKAGRARGPEPHPPRSGSSD
jgi:hypothetical protein